MPLIEMIVWIAKRKKATPAQIAWAWLLALKPFIAPFPEMNKTGFGEKDAELANMNIQGERHNEGLLSMSEN